MPGCSILPNNHGLFDDVGHPPLSLFTKRPRLLIYRDRAAYVMGRNNFLANNKNASLGKYSFGFMWAAVACLFLATVMFCVAGVTSKKDSTYGTRTTKRSRFGRKKSTRSRGSFIDSESQRRVKDEY